LASVAGVTFGLALYLAAAVAGLTRVIMQWPWVFQGLRWLGVAYLVWLAFESWKGSAQAADASRRGTGPSGARLFWRGVLANLLNPKAALFYVVLLPGFTSSEAGNPAAQMLFLGSIHLGVATSVHVAIVMTASGLRARGAAWRKRTDRIAGRFTATCLVVIAVWLAWEARGV
jgi:threonine/homoserine/homoserine lactone efflux protein